MRKRLKEVGAIPSESGAAGASAHPPIERTRHRVAELREYERNPRAISRERMGNLMRSLAEDPAFLEARPLIVNSYPGREGVVVAGNMRLRAAVALGWEDLPVVLVSLAPEVEAAWNVRDNNEWGDWIERDLAKLLAELGGQGVDLGLLGFDPTELERLLALAVDIPADADAFDPTPPAVPESRVGDLYLLGPHRLVCGDSRDEGIWKILTTAVDGTVTADDATVMADDGKATSHDGMTAADCMWTDPPYGVDVVGAALPSRGTRRHKEIAGDHEVQVAPLLRAVFARADGHLSPGAPFYIAGPGGRVGAAFAEAIVAAGWHLAQTLVWVKNGFVPGRSDYHHQHEQISYGWKPGAPHLWLGATDRSSVIDDEPSVGDMTKKELVALVKELWNSRGTDVIREDKPLHNDVHPTMKPIGLITTMLANSTKRGALVIDPFAGSGSTLVAAEVMGRRAALIELDPGYADVIVRRWRELRPGTPVARVRGGRREEIAA